MFVVFVVLSPQTNTKFPNATHISHTFSIAGPRLEAVTSELF
jgi:hypothetical protein